MVINSIKQSLSATTAQPLVDLIKLINAGNVRKKLDIVNNSVTATTINEFVCLYENIPLRQVMVVAGGVSIELSFSKIEESINLESINTLTMTWHDKNGLRVMVDLHDIFKKIDHSVINNQLVEAVRFYSNLELSKHGVVIEYANYLDNGNEVSELSVVVDGVS